MISISYGICVCNERKEIELLINQIKQHIRKDIDEIVVLFDSENGTLEVKEYLDKINISMEFEKIQFHRIMYPLNKDFASFKNELKKHCVKNYIFQIDADELLHDYLIKLLPQILEYNQVDVINIPRVNTVKGLTQEDINKWGWKVDDRNRVNWPDFQSRIIANKPELIWINKVHEKIIGYKTLSHLPSDSEHYTLIHDKTIERQRIQNQFYNTI